MARRPLRLTRQQARRFWIAAQGLAEHEPFGAGPGAVAAAIKHLGYVQIDTINVIERCHHHILFNRIPSYQRADLGEAQSIDRSIFEYWTHALSYVATEDLKYFLPAMKAHRAAPNRWFASVAPKELNKVLKRLRTEGPLSIRDIDDDDLVEKDHAWASRKPSKKALQMAFYNGQVAVAARTGMLKTYDLLDRHFGWDAENRAPRPATERQILDYKLDRALRSQNIVSLDSICYLDAPTKKPMAELIDRRVRRRRLVPVVIEGLEKVAFWAKPDIADQKPSSEPDRIHILSPFDPLVIQRRRTSALFEYDHLFEAYVPRERRKLGYFALPVLVGDEIVAAIDLKADRQENRLLVQNWTWTAKGAARLHQPMIDEALDRFAAFQFAA